MGDATRTPLFISRWVYWLLAGVLVFVLSRLGSMAMHVREFPMFISLVMLMAFVTVLAVRWLYRPGERITREPLEAEPDDS